MGLDHSPIKPTNTQASSMENTPGDQSSKLSAGASGFPPVTDKLLTELLARIDSLEKRLQEKDLEIQSLKMEGMAEHRERNNNLAGLPFQSNVNTSNSMGNEGVATNQGEVNNYFTKSEMLQLMNTMSIKNAPRPDPFKLGTGRSFPKFLNSFEEYAKVTFGGDHTRNHWTGELGRLLVGELKELYLAAGGSDSTYDDMCIELTDYVEKSEGETQNIYREEFAAANKRPEENLKIYAVRLENLARKAFKLTNINNLSDLKNKFLETINKREADLIRHDEYMMKWLTDQEMTWVHIKNSAAQIDREKPLKLNSLGTGAAEQNVQTIDTIQIKPRLMNDSFKNSYGHKKLVHQMSTRIISRSDRKSPLEQNYQSTSPNRRSHILCDWCGRSGHWRKHCRVRLGLCLLCGASDHLVKDCARSRRNRESSRYTICPMCSGNHVGMVCPKRRSQSVDRNRNDEHDSTKNYFSNDSTKPIGGRRSQSQSPRPQRQSRYSTLNSTGAKPKSSPNEDQACALNH
jgi:hypothetical protein